MNMTIFSALPPGKNIPVEEREEVVHRTGTSETPHKHQVNAKGNGSWGGKQGSHKKPVMCGKITRHNEDKLILNAVRGRNLTSVNAAGLLY